MADPQDSAGVETPRFAEMNNFTVGEEAHVLFATDDWFSAAEHLLKPDEPVFKPGMFTEEGKWMDGWETRRKRTVGHDWCIIKLAFPAVICGVDFDTAFFTGNYVPRVSLQAVMLSDEEFSRFPKRIPKRGQAADSQQLRAMQSLKTEKWKNITGMCRLRPGYKLTRHNFVAVTDRQVYNVVRLNAYPDGGIARLSVFGHAYPDWRSVDSNSTVDLVLTTNGGVCVAHSNAHYGHPRNLIAAHRGHSMADGWETARRLDRPAILEADGLGKLLVPGEEWAIFRLGHRGTIQQVEVDTCHFKGNYPDSVRLDACDVSRDLEDHLDTYYNWTPILRPQKMQGHHQHFYSGDDIMPHSAVTHVRITISPDGGISRLRINGRLDEERILD